MHNHSYENEFNLHVNEISFSYERMSTKTRFEKEAKGNSEIGYYYCDFFLNCVRRQREWFLSCGLKQGMVSAL